MQCRSITLIAVRADENLDVLIERHQKAQEAFHRKLAELASKHFRNIGLANAKEPGSFNSFHAALFHDAVDFEDQLCFYKMLLRISNTDVFEYVLTHGAIIASHSLFPYPWDMEVHFTPEQEAQLAQIAARSGTDPVRLVQDAALRVLAEDARFRAAVREGIEQADRGMFIEEEEMDARFEEMLRS